MFKLTSDASSVSIVTRDDRSFKLVVGKATAKGESKKIADLIERHCFFDLEFEQLQKSFAYKYKLHNPNNINGWKKAGDVISELARSDEDIGNSKLFVSRRNQDFSLCPTYPEVIVVPRSMEDQEVNASAAFRTKSRLPALTYLYKPNGCSIWRSSQPRNGLMSQSTEDQKMLREIAVVKSGYQTLSIYDCRPQMNAQGNRIKGGGFESTAIYTNSEFSFCGIENIHAVSKVFEKL